MKNYIDTTINGFIDELSMDQEDSFNESEEDFEESVVSAWTIGVFVVTGSLAFVGGRMIGSAVAIKKLDSIYKSRDRSFKPIKELTKKTFKSNALTAGNTFDSIMGNLGDEKHGFMKLATELMCDHTYVWYNGKEPVCVASCAVSTDKQEFVYAINKKYEKYKNYYLGCMSFKLYGSDRGMSALLKLYKKEKKNLNNDVSESSDFDLDDDMNIYCEDTDFEEGVFRDQINNKKFQNMIYDALAATYALCKFSYGVEQDGHIYNIDRSEYPKYYHYLSREDFQRLKGGLSYDYCRFLYPYLTSKGYNTDLFFIEIEGTMINHTFPIITVPFDGGNKYLYCEAAKKNIYGAYSTNDLDGLLNTIVSVLRNETILTKPTKVVIRKYKQVKGDDLSYNELLKVLRKGEIYDEYPIKPRTGYSSSAKAKSSKFNPKLLTELNPDIMRIK